MEEGAKLAASVGGRLDVSIEDGWGELDNEFDLNVGNLSDIP